MSAFISSSIDYGNKLLFGSTYDVKSYLQQIHTDAAEVILRISKPYNMTTYLISLYLLSIKERSTCIIVLCYHYHNSTASSYFTDMLQKKSSHSSNTRSISHIMSLLNRSAHSKATLCDRSFSLVSHGNLISNEVTCDQSESSSRLKTFLFHSVYKD